MTAPIPDPLRQIDEALETFRRLSSKAVKAAGGRDVVLADQARHEATFALAAVGLAFKQALKAARPDAPDA